jgi:hypothetical protein
MQTKRIAREGGSSYEVRELKHNAFIANQQELDVCS